MTGRERFLAACAGQPVDATPVWCMRQAGGQLPSYLALRERHSVIEIAKTPALCAEVSTTAATTLGTDGAVLFADVMLPAEAMGVELELTAEGPLIDRPVRETRDLARLRAVDVATDLGFVLESIGRVRAELGDRAAVIGVAGGPFTLAAYLVEGGPSRDQLTARRLMHGEPELWADLLDRITDVTVAYVRAQVLAGADAVQVFDSWAGTLGPDDYDRNVAPWSRRILAAIADAGAPAIHFAAASSALLERLADGATVVGVDSGQSLTVARDRLGTTPVQGNLDPARLGTGWGATTAGIDAVLAANAGRDGHIFNSGHAIPRDTAPSLLRDVVNAVHERTALVPIPALEEAAR
jgi:uroporphyrinogen decarboxylase